jgi:LuxR family transcriptional regulator, maltose regulon positive regulatory protein
MNVPSLHPVTLQRHSLLEQMPSPGVRLLLVSAPVGFGKTTLLASWCHALAADSNYAVAWLALDADDNEPQRFLAYLAGAFARAYPTMPEWSQIATTCQQGTAIEAALAHIINMLSATQQPGVLVLDDYHHISSPPVHMAIAFLLEHMPAQIMVAIASRADPPLPLARLRASRQLLELRSTDLCFSRAEACTLVRSTLGYDVHPQQVNQIYDMTEGWPAGVQLVTVSLCIRDKQLATGASCRTTDMAQLPIQESFTAGRAFIFAYLADEVFSRLPTEMQTFLLYSSVLDTLTAPLCDALLGENNDPGSDTWSGGQTSASMLTTLYQANLFLTQLDMDQHWYRYQTLFLTFLRERLSHDSPELLPILHRRACAWLARHAMPALAIEHALYANDMIQAIELIEQVAVSMIEHGEYAKLHHWLDQIPDDVFADRPAMLIWSAWSALLAGEIERVEASCDQVERHLAVCNEQALLGSGAHLQAHLARLRGDSQRTIAEAQKALALLPDTEASLRAGSRLALGIGLVLAGEQHTAEQILAKALAECQKHNFIGMLVAYNGLGDAATGRGALREAAIQYQQVLVQAGDRAVWERWQAMIRLGNLAREWNNLTQAQEQLGAALALAEAAGVEVYFVNGYVALARTLAAQGATSAAQRLFEQALTLAHRLGAPAHERMIYAYQTRLALAQHDDITVSAWQAGLPGHDRAALPLDMIEQLTLVRILIDACRKSRRHDDVLRAENLLAAARSVAERLGQTEHLIEIELLQAQCADVDGQLDQSAAALERALGLATAGGYMRIFLGEGASILPILERLVAQHSAISSYARRLLATLRHELEPDGGLRSNAVGQDDPATTHLVEELSEREITVLQRVAQGASNQDIANDMVISVGTVKSHLNHILGKLEARNRTEAVARAREFGLISTW